MPVRVLLAAETLPIARIRRLAAGMILEFDRDVEQPGTLLINNRELGHGEVVRIGECYGLRIQTIGDAATRIRSLGK